MNSSRKDGPKRTAPDPDEDLLRQARQAPEGDIRAFEQIVERHHRRIVSNCRYITRDPNNCEDLAQEVLTKAFFGLKNFEGRSSLRHWLQQIKINHCLNFVKKQEGKNHISIEEPKVEEFEQLKVSAVAQQQVEAMSDQKLIGSILDSMSTTLRVPLILCDMDELSYEEVAQNLGISLSAAKMRIKRAREEFRNLYKSRKEADAGARTR
jgi:RNA polymerase sigma-70 factor (ECF subfamily)